MRRCEGCNFMFKESGLTRCSLMMSGVYCHLCEVCENTPLGTAVINDMECDKLLVTINYGINYLASLLREKE